jgi:hypothetical protein
MSGVEAIGPNCDFRSGLRLARPSANSAKTTCLYSAENNILLFLGFADNVEELSLEERAEMAKAPGPRKI